MSKTIETHLQSNEVRIPKKVTSAVAEFDVSSTAAPCQYFKSSFARSLSFSQGGGQGGNGHYGGDNHFTRSLDFEVNYGGGALSTIPDGGSSQTTPSASPVFDPDRDLLPPATKLANGIGTSNGGVVKTLWNYAKGSPSKSASPAGTPSKLASGAASTASAAAMSGSGSSSSTPRKSVEANEIEVLRLRKECQNLIEENRRLVNLAANSGYAINGVMNGNGHAGPGSSVSNGHHGGGGGHSASGSGSLTTSLGLGLAGGGSGGGGGGGTSAGVVAGMYSTVESVILQTQVETLQWQLKQVDSSRQMYRAVMEEVVRYLDRCYRSLDAIGHTTNIGRSKSVLQVSRVPSSSSSSIHNNHNDSDSSNASSPRARSSTNLIDVQQKASASASASLSSANSSYTKKQHQLQQQQQQQELNGVKSQPGTTTTNGVANGNHPLLLDDDCVGSPSPAGSYSTFRDFTWRRSPKRTAAQTLPISSAEVDPEKLAQEAFRLLRTVQNLLNTQEPTLSSQSSSASSGLDSLLLLANGAVGGASSTTGSTTTLTGSGGAGVAAVVNTRSNVGFSRKLNMRGSRLSLRSSTDDSVHSTSSSSNKTETDEDNTDRPSPPLLHHHHHHHHHPGSSSSSSTSSSSNSGHLINHRHSANIDRIKEMMISSSAEDESGFSSMNSFQEIGLPLVNSTMLSAAHGGGGVDSASSAASSTGSVSFVSDESSDARDATVIPTTTTTASIAINRSPSKLGIPAVAKVPEIPTRVTQTAAYEHHNHFVNHRRWDSAPVMPQKLKIHSAGAGSGVDSDGGVSSRVLWV